MANEKLTTFIAVGTYVWGAGEDIKTALKNAKAAGGSNYYRVNKVTDDWKFFDSGTLEASVIERVGYFDKNFKPITKTEHSKIVNS